MNVERRTKARKINPYEKHQQQYYMTSAGVKNSFAYQKLIELFEKQIITPSSAFIWGCDYRVPMLHGLLPKDYLNDIRTSQTFKEESFAREWTPLLSLNFLNCENILRVIYTTA